MTNGKCPMTNGKCSDSDGVFLGVGVRGVCGDDVANPAQRAAGPKPESRRYNQPENSCQNATIVELPHSRNIRLKTPANTGSRIRLPPQWNVIRHANRFCSAARQLSRPEMSSAFAERSGCSQPPRANAASRAALHSRGSAVRLLPSGC
jgi:hypothetical protein